jgi:hypothetical protein
MEMAYQSPFIFNPIKEAMINAFKCIEVLSGDANPRSDKFVRIVLDLDSFFSKCAVYTVQWRLLGHFLRNLSYTYEAISDAIKWIEFGTMLRR